MSKQTNYELSRQLYDAGLRLETEKCWSRIEGWNVQHKLEDSQKMEQLNKIGNAVWEIIPAPDFDELFAVLPDRFTAKVPYVNQKTPAINVEFWLQIRKTDYGKMAVAYKNEDYGYWISNEYPYVDTPSNALAVLVLDLVKNGIKLESHVE